MDVGDSERLSVLETCLADATHMLAAAFSTDTYSFSDIDANWKSNVRVIQIV